MQRFDKSAQIETVWIGGTFGAQAIIKRDFSGFQIGRIATPAAIKPRLRPYLKLLANNSASFAINAEAKVSPSKPLYVLLLKIKVSGLDRSI
jgi:hypothetical protein